MSSIKWGVNDYSNSTPLYRGANGIDRVMYGSVEVWKYEYAPSTITNFSATDYVGIDSITVYFSVADALPAATYNLINTDTEAVLASNITSGYVYSTTSTSIPMRVDAVNSVGTTPSNANRGYTKAPAGTQTFTSSGTFTTPRGYTSLTVCMIGGGGSGYRLAWTGAVEHVGGGNSGGYKSQTTAISATPTAKSVVCGNGGAARGTNGSNAGSSSTFNGLTAAGGAGGLRSASYGGNGGTRTLCYGTYTHGIMEYHSNPAYYYGGQAGFGNGGRGNLNASGVAGSRGAGGGSSNTTAGAGGRGVVKITWS